MIQTLIEKYQQSLDVETDSEDENEIEQSVIEIHRELLAKNKYQQQLKTIEDKSMKKRIYDFPNHSNFDDTG